MVNYCIFRRIVKIILDFRRKGRATNLEKRARKKIWCQKDGVFSMTSLLLRLCEDVRKVSEDLIGEKV